MRAIVLAVLAVACRVPDEHFTVRDATDTGDGSADASTAKTAGYLLDKVDGLYRVTFDAPTSTWAAVSPATPAGASPVVVLTSTHGTHLYVLDRGSTSAPTQVLDFAIRNDGSLTTAGTVDLSSTCASHMGMRASIASTQLAVVCPATNAVIPIAINADDSLGAKQTVIALPSGVGGWDVKFANGGSCIVVLGPLLGKQLLTYTPSGAAKSSASTTLAPWILAMDPDGQTVYVLGYDTTNHGGVEAWGVASNCSLTQTATPQTWMSASSHFGGTVDPAGQYLYAVGDDGVYQYALALGQISLANTTPYLPPTNTGVSFAALMDSSFPSMLFVTGVPYGGTTIAHLGTGGVPTPSTLLTAGTQPWSLALVP